MPLPKFLGQFNPVNFLGGRSNDSPKRRDASQPYQQIQAPPPKRRRTDNVDDQGDVRLSARDIQSQRTHFRDQRLRSRPSETSIDVLIQSPPAHSGSRHVERQPTVSLVSSSHLPEPGLAEQHVQSSRPRPQPRHRGGKSGESLDRPANMQSPSSSNEGCDSDDNNDVKGKNGEKRMTLHVKDHGADQPKEVSVSSARINTNLAVILSDGRPKTANKSRFRDRMTMPISQSPNGMSAALSNKRRNGTGSGDELSEELIPWPPVRRHQQRQQQRQQSGSATAASVDLSPGYRTNRPSPASKEAATSPLNGFPKSSPKASPKGVPKSSPLPSVPSQITSSLISLSAETIMLSPLSVKAAFRQPDNFFVSGTDTLPFPLTIYEEEPDFLVPLDQARARAEKLYWLRVDLLKIREFSFNINSPFVFLLFSQGDSLCATMGLKFASKKHARQLVAWATNSTISRTIKFTDTASPEQQKRKFERCLDDMTARKNKAVGAAVDSFRLSSPAADKLPLSMTDDVVVFHRTRSSRNLNDDTEMFEVNGSSSSKKMRDEATTIPAAATDTTPDHAIWLRSSDSRTSTAKRPLLQEVEFERWTVKNPNWAQDWRLPLTYSRTTVDKDDLGRLDEGEFLNDNIINFYIQFLQDTLKKSEPSIAKRVYFHNTFFYEKLRPRKGREIVFDGVKRWTAKVELFSYDYIVVPVNENAHWWLAIICNVPKILAAAQPDKATEEQTIDQDDSKIEKPDQFAPAAEAIDVHRHHPHSVVVADENKYGTENDIEFVSEAAKKNSVPLPLPNGRQRDAQNVMGQAKPSKKKEELIVSGLLEIDDEEAKPVTDMLKAIHDDPHIETASIIKDIPDAAASSKKDTVDDNEVTEIISDVAQPSMKLQTAAERGGFRGAAKSKKVFIPPGKKQDPADPRIFTLDSLGSVHAASVSHLKQWLMAEIAERKDITPQDPGRLGMTAKAIPQQENFCDCGVYLLLYIQEFVKDPDSFIEDIVLRQERAWNTSAPDMRKQLRDLILHMQKEYQVAEEAKRRLKKKVSTATAKQSIPIVSAKPVSPPVASTLVSEAVESTVGSPISSQVSTQDDSAKNGVIVPTTSIANDSHEYRRENGGHDTEQGYGSNIASRSPASDKSLKAGLGSRLPNNFAPPDEFERRP
ncbi:hypothetical protein SEPCBS57363_002412 [Sporothrix epigloea]|uniref:Ubiquitin-like protease family profile domain-containing protein n=1 Tax=Sporothrix epigloea TaxID=1892477 RepID=A0ABP0DFR9_9PEZI